jgi:DNA polymerase-4
VSHRPRKSIGSEKTYSEDLADVGEMLARLEKLAEEVWQDMREKHMTARTITVKVKFENFEQVTRSITINSNISKLEDITTALQDLLNKAEVHGRRIRLLGVSVSNLIFLEQVDEEQLTLL